MQPLTGSTAALSLHRSVNRTAVDYPRERSVPELFGARARQTPEQHAVVQGERQLTYRQLDRLSNGLALRLTAQGVGPGTVVGVSMVRSPELVVALLAVLKCGGSYLPFDAHWPDARLRTLFADAGCRWILTDRAPALSGRPWPCQVLSAGAQDAVDAETGPAVAVSADALAYINFTSGSTGRPKGVPVRHRSIANLVHGARYAPLGPGARLLQLAPVTFDAATFEIWGALLRGGVCVLYPDSFIRLSRLAQVLREQRIGVLFLTTALFNAVIDERPDALAGVDTVLTGGELHSIRHVATALGEHGPGRLVHVYGPTEATTFATYHPVDDLTDGSPVLPIGRPLQNTRLYVVHSGPAGERLCEAGATGEIWLAGDGLSPGYLGQEELTAERFVHRLVDGRAERLYRTGDHGRLQPDGSLVFTGRVDDQVKVNGFRIELGEISHHLDRHPAVRRSYVTVDTRGDKSLVAFVLSADDRGDPVTEAALREHLRRALPPYMVPARIHLCAELPLTDTGKTDRHALLAAHRPGAAARP
ncbi:amino acid adenylation domain-containing protein [Streptomyces monticola]|uniref:Amino acid adenylation domain-containing protein n=1 Tax=Streptomyces monticola TaxID=2666263 RepID=A0ABW2JQ99_9ACTN